jgi:hypothetical protein
MGVERYRVGGHALDYYGSGYGPVAGSCGHGEDPSISIKNFLNRPATLKFPRQIFLHGVS